MKIANRVLVTTLSDLLELIETACKTTHITGSLPEMKENLTEEKLKQIIDLGFLQEVENGASLDIESILEKREPHPGKSESNNNIIH